MLKCAASLSLGHCSTEGYITRRSPGLLLSALIINRKVPESATPQANRPGGLLKHYLVLYGVHSTWFIHSTFQWRNNITNQRELLSVLEVYKHGASHYYPRYSYVRPSSYCNAGLACETLIFSPSKTLAPAFQLKRRNKIVQKYPFICLNTLLREKANRRACLLTMPCLVK